MSTTLLITLALLGILTLSWACAPYEGEHASPIPPTSPTPPTPPTPRRSLDTTTPPPDAIILFDGSDTAQLQMRNGGGPLRWPVVDSQLMVDASLGDVLSVPTLGDGHYHVEWLSPDSPDPLSQLGGNSGIKFEERYEIQILNTPGPPHELADNEAGAIYRQHPASINASTGPNTWQTYDAWYQAPRYEAGQKVADARLTLYWNGVLVHDDVAMANKTGASKAEGPEPGRFLLQGHNSDANGVVRFRNIWFQPSG